MSHNENGWETKDGLRLYAQGWEPAAKSKGTICLVHGLGEHSSRYAHVADFLNQAGYTLLTFDLRGHGKSQGQRGHSPSLETLHADISTLIEEAKQKGPDIPIFLYGHSLGGLLVLSHITRHTPQLAGVISTGPILRPGFDPPAWKLTFGKMMRSIWPTLSMSNEIDRQALSRDSEVVNAYNTDPLVHDRITARLGIDMLEEGLWLLANTPKVKIPTLLMQGSEDRLCSPHASQEFAQEAGELCTLKIWEGLYHELHNEPEKNQVLEYLVHWLNEKL